MLTFEELQSMDMLTNALYHWGAKSHNFYIDTTATGYGRIKDDLDVAERLRKHLKAANDGRERLGGPRGARKAVESLRTG